MRPLNLATTPEPGEPGDPEVILVDGKVKGEVMGELKGDPKVFVEVGVMVAGDVEVEGDDAALWLCLASVGDRLELHSLSLGLRTG